VAVEAADAALQPDEPEDGAECLTGVAQVAWAAQRRPRGLKRPTKAAPEESGWDA
jgi:hypothetical protein